MSMPSNMISNKMHAVEKIFAVFIPVVFAVTGPAIAR